MLTAFETMLNKGKWVSWPDGQQYFVIRPEDFHELMEPYDKVLDAEDEAEKATHAGLAKSRR
ncbi:hypothetical protein [Rhizobium gallicum]|uniref:hypothetical protein n=1 Tax=Rhizobium gallicum TaxID=56730 RepID=UPI001EF7A269|nr:hypothetical protein [Rhizobium gallicum]ULJ74201.1 hypothetical protein L2W42_22420 [Rhizobium gallicum]